MIVGCYSLDLYCDSDVCLGVAERLRAFSKAKAQYTDELGSVCRARARRQGWVLDQKTGRATCPGCKKAR